MIAFIRLFYERFKFTIFSFNRISSGIDKKVLEELANEGFVVVPDFMSNTECKKVCDSIDFSISDEKIPVQWDKSQTDARLVGAEMLDVTIEKFHRSDRISSISDVFYGEPSSSLFILGGRLRFNGVNLGSGGGWHRDSFSRQLKAMVYLTDVEGSNGAFQFVPKSHKFGHMVRFNLFLNQSSLSKRYALIEVDRFCSRDSEERGIELTGKAGTLILFDSSGLHRGTPIREGSRYALTSYLMRNRSIDDAKYLKFGLRKR